MHSHDPESCSIVVEDDLAVPYSVRESRRARRVSLKYSPLEGLVVVVPDRFDCRRVPAILNARREWIARVALQYRDRAQHYADEPGMPESVVLQARQYRMELTYAPSARPFAVRRDEGALRFSGRIEARRVQEYLRHWLKQEARAYLVPLLMQLAKDRGIAVRGCTVRLQRSRWGSCSAANGINLNARLLFLPEPLVEYVCLHELAHCTHHNHSAAFWAHLERMLPGARERDGQLRDAWHHVPRWSFC